MADQTKLKDITFLIPVRLDSIVRLENLMMVIDFLSTHFETNIYILEAAKIHNNILKSLLPEDVSHKFIEDHDPVFHRTRYINLLVQNSKTPYLAVWDTDVIVPPKQIIQSVELLRKKEAQFIYPYEHKFLDTSPILREIFFKTKNLDLLIKNTGKMKEMYIPEPVGGGFFADRASYIQSGMENENFYGWGREDGDRLNRWKILEHQYKRIPGPLFHFTHERGLNSNFHSTKQNGIKMSEIQRIASMSKKELEEETEKWNHK